MYPKRVKNRSWIDKKFNQKIHKLNLSMIDYFIPEKANILLPIDSFLNIEYMYICLVDILSKLWGKEMIFYSLPYLKNKRKFKYSSGQMKLFQNTESNNIISNTEIIKEPQINKYKLIEINLTDYIRYHDSILTSS
jgi:hypothetical protein